MLQRVLGRHIPIKGKIIDPLANEVVQILNDISPQTPVVFRIDSEGGYLDAFQKIAYEVYARPNPFTAYVEGVCHSAACMMLQFCSRIGAHPNSSFMMHYPRYSQEDVSRQTGFPAECDIVLYDDPIYLEFLQRFSKQRNIPIKLLEELSMLETILSSKEAEKLGMIDYIL